MISRFSLIRASLRVLRSLAGGGFCAKAAMQIFSSQCFDTKPDRLKGREENRCWIASVFGAGVWVLSMLYEDCKGVTSLFGREIEFGGLEFVFRLHTALVNRLCVPNIFCTYIGGALPSEQRWKFSPAQLLIDSNSVRC